MFSLLPAPKHATTKEVGRVLVPHSLKTQKPKPSAPARKPLSKPNHPQTHPKVTTGLAQTWGSDSDSDHEDNPNTGPGVASFFSLEDQAQTTSHSESAAATLAHVPASQTVSCRVPTVESGTSKDGVKLATASDSRDSEAEEEGHEEVEEDGGSLADVPLQFNAHNPNVGALGWGRTVMGYGQQQQQHTQQYQQQYAQVRQ